MRIRWTVLVVSFVTAGARGFGAQSAAVPTTYAITEFNTTMVGDLTLKVYRDGVRELVEMSRPKSAMDPQGFHTRTLYDFQTHKQYAWDLLEAAEPCTASAYTDAAAPSEYDMISGGKAVADYMAQSHPRSVGTEVVAGVAATIVEMPDFAGRGTIKVWVAVKGGYQLRMVLVPKSGPQVVMLDVKELTFAKPLASLLVVPANCARAPAPVSTTTPARPAQAQTKLNTTSIQVSDAEANALPPMLLPPPGFQIEASSSKHFDFFHVQVAYPKGGTTAHVDAEGRTWMPMMKLVSPNKTSDETDKQMRTNLAQQGWELLTPSGTLVAHKIENGKERWFSGSAFAGDYRATIVEVGPAPHALTLAAPAPTPETVGAGDNFPYLTSFPGSTFIRTVQDPTKMFNAAMPGKPEELVGQPLVRKLYQLPLTVSTYEFVSVYSDALAKAGWTILRTAAGSDAQVVAHWTKNGRDVFVYLAGDSYSVADVGAQNEAKKLAADLARDGHVAIYGIYFDVDQATLRPESETALQHVLELLKSDASLKLEVQGHTDNTGAAPHNQALSDQRALSVKTWLVSHGVAAGRLAPKGYGDTQPVGDNKSPEGRAKNRRVELKKA